MANDYQLEELGPRAFEQLTVALASAAFGPGIEVYGSGKDGGREATFDGQIVWDASGATAWNGYTVIQAKQREHVASPADNLAWLKGQIRAEFDAWMNPKSKRDRFPQYILFVTNVRLSAEIKVGGVDEIQKYVTEELDRSHKITKDTPRKRGLRAGKVWHRDTLNAFISGNQSVRAAFPAILTLGDVLTRLQVLPGVVDADNLAPVLRDHASSTLRNDRWIRFGEAGGLTSRQSVEHVIVDLPARVGAHDRSGVLGACIERGNGILRRSMWSASEPRHLVITGAAGNGKSTLAKYLTQVYRSHFLREDDNGDAVDEVIAGTDMSLERLSLSGPTNRRWPLNVSLPAMANAMGPSGGPSLLRWLSEQITTRASIEIQPATLKDWLRAWPCVLFLDGLDEVTAPSLRQRVIDEISELVDTADSQDADLFIVVTTRPTGYTERLLPEHFSQIDLDYLTTEEAVAYGRHVTLQRLHDDVSLRDQLLARFDSASSVASTERLLKTPLQVLILTFILETLGDLPTTRYGLFWGYFDTVYRRETEKPTTYRDFLRNHRDDITELHERVGLLLQADCEGTDETRARLAQTDLHALARDRMFEVGHDDPLEAKRLADEIIKIATTRLVLLSADEDETVSFEVRSLQELMAARALVSGDDETIRRNLALTAPSPHWRNTWLFAAGKLFTEGDHRRTLVLDIVDRFDRDNNAWPGWLYPIGPELAAHLLDDGLATMTPLAQQRLVEVALRCLHGPVPEEFTSVAQGLTYATNRQTLRTLIRNKLRTAFAGTPAAAAVASVLVSEGDFGSRIPGQPESATLRRHVAMWSAASPEKGATVTIGNLLREPFAELHDQPGADLLEPALAECDKLRLYKTSTGDLWPRIVNAVFSWSRLKAVLNDRDASSLLQLCVGAIDPSSWAASSMLAWAVWSARSHEPVRHHLQIPYLRARRQNLQND